MSSRQSVLKIAAFLLVVSLFLAACERPLQDAGDTAEEVATEVAQELEEVDGEEAPEETVAPAPDEAEEAVATDEETPEATEVPSATPADTPESEVEDDASPRAGDDEEAEPTEEAQADDEEEAEAAEETAAEDEEAESAEEEMEAAEEESAEEAAATEAETTGEERVHVVQPGENLYRIGLQYGISWVVLAEYNGIPNANAIYTGQQIRIPATDDATPTPTPTPDPSAETTYVVQPGDNLYRIGRAYGVSWVEIAELNGIVNPNQIYAGQELRIPAEEPDPAPQVTHTVQANETLFRISLQYGVSWTSIAEANDLTSPYVIYPGQTLVIPGG
ncbi:MAG TPA: LysM peptidoglycan-binding domain-containing protein [Candidatus Sulfomarinibacteraceae bacterium]|nr:LysM peptidoglycan-binding domain-containing protein [Candidatus Sulfomarinibacteraceae bacterium]